MHKLTLVTALVASTLSGCVVYSDTTTDYVDNKPVIVEEDPVIWNEAPFIIDAEAGVYFDDYLYEDIWYFEAAVDDYDGPQDVVAVWADVYDPYNGEYIESFELFPLDTYAGEPSLWFSDWLGSSTWLDPFYQYEVDFVAYDSFDDTDIVTMDCYTY